MRDIEAEKVFALTKEKERKLLYVSLVKDQEKRAVKRVFSDIFRYSKVKGQSKEQRKSQIR